MNVRVRKIGRTVYVMFTYMGSAYRFSTGINVDDRDWDGKKHRLRKSVPGYEGKVLVIESAVNRAHGRLLELQVSGRRLVREDFRRLVRGNDVVQGSLSDDYEGWLRVKRKEVALPTYRKYEQFGRLYVSQMAPELVYPFDRDQYIAFRSFLKSSGLSDNTIAGYMRSAFSQFLRSVNQPVDFIDTNEKYGYPDCFSRSERLKIIEFNCSGYLGKARDLLNCQFLTGMRYSDTQRFRMNWVNGLIIEYIQLKTSQVAYAPFTKELEALLLRYDGKMPKISNQKYNKYLKELASVLEFRRQVKGKPLSEVVTSHWGRRTFITHHLDDGVPLHVVQQMVGKRTYDSIKPYISISKKKIENIALWQNNEG